ncbi:hypothetical protein [Sphingomonas alba]|uniref:Uncharacterized protein n=1 Tax=Sphingomonas alba TaxID=2908208 RepID=A0ABT0RK24_9SPHN|nr:hypothetical protein [Sphingomonas alba]MCL6682988.1 hypothetical protein [Sphingomonas alba]
MTRSNTTAEWPRLMLDTSQLWDDAAMVVALRSWRIIAGGPAVARQEVERMISEKVEAGAELAGALIGGKVNSPQSAARKALSIYAKRVRENRRRLG